MRQSVATTRSSHGAALNSAAASAKLLEKKKEYEAVAALDRVAALYLARMEGLAEDCDIMAIAGEVHGQVLEQWPKMFQILDLFLANREQSAVKDDAQSTAAGGQLLVRVPIDDLKQEVERES